MLLLVSCTPKGPLDKTLSSAKENRSELRTAKCFKTLRKRLVET